MTDIKFKTRVLNAREVTDDIHNAIKRGIRNSGKPVGRDTERAAKGRIQQVNAIWRGELIDSFKTTTERRGNKLVVTLINTSDHAAPIEFGAEYDERGPPVMALLPWVATKMTGFRLPAGEDVPDVENIETELADEELEPADVATVIDVVSPELLQKAFWVQQHIKENGIDPVKFMRSAEEYAEDHGPDEVADRITVSLRLRFG